MCSIIDWVVFRVLSADSSSALTRVQDVHEQGPPLWRATRRSILVTCGIGEEHRGVTDFVTTELGGIRKATIITVCQLHTHEAH